MICRAMDLLVLSRAKTPEFAKEGFPLHQKKWLKWRLVPVFQLQHCG
jgi:hypothetical protein